MTDAVDRICTMLADAGGRLYGGEQVTQLDHALQCAALAEHEEAGDELVVAALLHDIGHLLIEDDGQAAARGEDARHEERGADWLSRWFGPGVTEAVRLHVAAKRYLCAADGDYFARLSPASVRSLEVQGGPFDGDQAGRFITAPYAREAVRLREWDEQGKVEGMPIPGVDHYRPHMERLLARRG